MNVRNGLFAWGLFVMIVGAAASYSATINPLSPFQLAIITLIALGVALAVAALLPRPAANTDETNDAPSAVTPADPAEPSELLDLGVGEQQPLHTSGAEIDLGDR